MISNGAVTAAVGRWRKRLGVSSWVFSWEWASLEALKEVMGDASSTTYLAVTTHDLPEHTARIRLNRDVKWTRDELDRVICHEVWHIVHADTGAVEVLAAARANLKPLLSPVQYQYVEDLLYEVLESITVRATIEARKAYGSYRSSD